MALAMALGFCFPLLRAWVWLVPALCGYSRYITGMHSPDVLVSWAAGAAMAWGLRRAWQKAALIKSH